METSGFQHPGYATADFSVAKGRLMKTEGFCATLNAMEKCRKRLKSIETQLQLKTGCSFKDLTFDNFVRYLYKPEDPASLGVTRVLFGILKFYVDDVKCV